MVLTCIYLMISDVEHLFQVPVGHLYVFFEKTFIQVFCPFLMGLKGGLFYFAIYELFMYFGY